MILKELEMGFNVCFAFQSKIIICQAINTHTGIDISYYEFGRGYYNKYFKHALIRSL